MSSKTYPPTNIINFTTNTHFYHSYNQLHSHQGTCSPWVKGDRMCAISFKREHHIKNDKAIFLHLSNLQNCTRRWSSNQIIWCVKHEPSQFSLLPVIFNTMDTLNMFKCHLFVCSRAETWNVRSVSNGLFWKLKQIKFAQHTNERVIYERRFLLSFNPQNQRWTKWWLFLKTIKHVKIDLKWVQAFDISIYIHIGASGVSDRKINQLFWLRQQFLYCSGWLKNKSTKKSFDLKTSRNYQSTNHNKSIGKKNSNQYDL
jgi:hypothetical protein